MTTPARRILVPTDFSETADRAMTTAIELGKPLGATLHLVHVYSPVMVLPPPLDTVALPSLFPQMVKRMEEALETRARRVRDAGLECQAELIEGSPHLELVRHAENSGADLIVMGTHGRGGLAHAILGSVTERVIHRAPCPVLVVPEPRKK